MGENLKKGVITGLSILVLVVVIFAVKERLYITDSLQLMLPVDGWGFTLYNHEPVAVTAESLSYFEIRKGSEIKQGIFDNEQGNYLCETTLTAGKYNLGGSPTLLITGEREFVVGLKPTYPVIAYIVVIALSIILFAWLILYILLD